MVAQPRVDLGALVRGELVVEPGRQLVVERKLVEGRMGHIKPRDADRALRRVRGRGRRAAHAARPGHETPPTSRGRRGCGGPRRIRATRVAAAAPTATGPRV